MIGKRLLLTGGTGYIGKWLTKFLIEEGYEVTILTLTGGGAHEKANVILCDITDDKSLKRSLKGCAFDYCIHLASANDSFTNDYGRQAFLVNTLGTRNILESLKLEGLKNFIYFSTFHVYGISNGKISEATVPHPKNEYALSHYFAEQFVKYYHKKIGLPFTILRLTNGYGCPIDKSSSKWYLLINDICRMAYENNIITLNSNGKAQRDFIWLGTVCQVVGLLLNLIKVPNDTFNLGSGYSFSVMEIAELVRKSYLSWSGKDVSITIKETEGIHDLSSEPLKVEMDKLQSLIPYHGEMHFDQEFQNIFNLMNT